MLPTSHEALLLGAGDAGLHSPVGQRGSFLGKTQLCFIDLDVYF